MTEITKILCVEDEIDIRENLVGILESEGFAVIEAENGKDGLDKFIEYKPDIVISDIMMPDMNGHQLLQAIRKNKEIDNSGVPFILLTALGQREDIIKGINLEASDYMVKPVDFDLLIAKIKEKTLNLKKIKEVQQKKIINLKSQFSSIVPQEILQYVNLINQISGFLKTEIYGPLPHKKYLEDINKIYIHSLKLKSIVNNLLSSQAISSQIDITDEIIKPIKFLQNFSKNLNSKFQTQITIQGSDDNLPQIRINVSILENFIKKIIGSILKLDSNNNINITASSDHLGRLIIIFYPQNPVDEDILKQQLEKSLINKDLKAQGLDIEVLFSNNNANVILCIPNYRVSKEKL